MFGFIKGIKDRKEKREVEEKKREAAAAEQIAFHTERSSYADGWQDLTEARLRMACLVETREQLISQGEGADAVAEINKAVAALAKHLGECEYLSVTGFEALQIKSGRAVKIVDRLMPI